MERKMPIKDADYNAAKAILTKAGSRTAAKTHTSHTGGSDRPDGHGQDLVDEATADFQKQDKGQPSLTSGMTAVHLKAINDAKKKLALR
jgi:hypothetical protein